MCMMIYHKTSNKAMKVFQENVDLQQYQKDEVHLIKEKSQQFILTNVFDCQKKMENQTEKQRFEILRDIVAQKNTEKYAQQFMNFDLDYKELLAQPFSEELQELQEKLKDIKKMSKEEVTKIFNIYFMDNLKFLSWEDRLSYYMSMRAVIVFAILILSFGCVYFLFKIFHDRKQLQQRKEDYERIKKFAKKQEKDESEIKEEKQSLQEDKKNK